MYIYLYIYIFDIFDSFFLMKLFAEFFFSLLFFFFYIKSYDQNANKKNISLATYGDH